MKKSIILFILLTLLSVGGIIYGCVFVDAEISEAKLTEETLVGDRKAAEGISVGFRADSGDDLHWINSYDYSSGKSESDFKRGEILEAEENSIFDDIQRDKSFGKGDLTKTVKTSLYEDIRFTGWDTESFVTELDYESLNGLQEKEIHAFYEKVQERVAESGKAESGEIRLGNYLDYYPVCFSFQFGAQRYDSGSALNGLKIYDVKGNLSPENGAAYDRDVALYTSLNDIFKIPVIDNEYHKYEVSKAEEYNPEISLGYNTEVTKLFDGKSDYYEFDPIMALQEEKDNNKLLFIVNNRTAKGKPVDVSQICGGYGVYELPIEEESTTVEMGPRVVAVPDLIPMHDDISMIYAIDETAEYVEMSLSEDNRYLAIFSVKDGKYFVEMIDADSWTSDGIVEIFPTSEMMTYAWGEDGSLVATNHEDYVAVLVRREIGETGNKEIDYDMIYSGKISSDFDDTFFTDKMASKKNSYGKYHCGVDFGLAVASTDGKVALVQNPPSKDLNMLSDTNKNDRLAALEVAVIDKDGLAYRGLLKNELSDPGNSIVPVGSENWVKW